MNWTDLNDESQLQQIETASFEKPQIIFVHSGRCPISRSALKRMDTANTSAWIVEVWHERQISNQIENKFGIKHESPQVLVLRDGKVVYNEDHSRIMPELVMAETAK